MRKVKTKRITTAALGLGIIAMIWLGTATITRAEEPPEPPPGIIVTPKDGHVEKDTHVFSNPQATVPQFVSIANGQVKILSLIISPPDGWSFIPFPYTDPLSFADVDVPGDLSGFIGDEVYDWYDPVTRHLEGFRVFAFFDESSLPNASQFPLQAEGNMEPPPGGTEPKEWHWAIKALNVTIVGPENVPGLSEYTYRLDQSASNITWSVDKSQAHIVGPTNQQTVTIKYDNTDAVIVRVSATATIANSLTTTTLDVAVVKVEVTDPVFETPGKPVFANLTNNSCLVADDPEKTWVTVHDPGSDWAAFKYAGTYQAHEPLVGVSTANEQDVAWSTSTYVTLTAPPARREAIEHIEVGYIQQTLEASHDAKYGVIGTDQYKRTGKVPASMGLDWLDSPTEPGPGITWPWYADSWKTPQVPASGNMWGDTIAMNDTPTHAFPKEWNPNNPGDPHATDEIYRGIIVRNFILQIATRTKDTAEHAEKHYFQQTWAVFILSVDYPPNLTASAVTKPTGWTTTNTVTEIPVHITPAVILHSTSDHGYEMWIPSGP